MFSNCTARRCPTGGSSGLFSHNSETCETHIPSCHFSLWWWQWPSSILKQNNNLPQSQIHSNQLRRAEQENHCLQKSVQTLTTQNKDLHVQLQEIKRRQAEIECKVQLCSNNCSWFVSKSKKSEWKLEKMIWKDICLLGIHLNLFFSVYTVTFLLTVLCGNVCKKAKCAHFIFKSSMMVSHCRCEGFEMLVSCRVKKKWWPWGCGKLTTLLLWLNFSSRSQSLRFR